jgi:transcriptional regulator with XRE-family HTH domain
MTNYEFAKRTGIDYTVASKIRNGRRQPSAESIIKIADAFGIPVESLVQAKASDDRLSVSRLIEAYLDIIPETNEWAMGLR